MDVTDWRPRAIAGAALLALSIALSQQGAPTRQETIGYWRQPSPGPQVARANWEPSTTTTTTTSEPPPPETTEPRVRTAAAGAPTEWPTSLEPCGGDLPPCWVKWRESHGDYSAQNPSSTASGAWQFLDSTWNGFMGYARAVYAPPDVQDEKAREVWAGGAGCSHWSAC